MMNFTASIVQRLTIGPSASQVALVKYGFSATTIFNLNTYSSTSQVVSAILNAQYTPDWNDEATGISYATSNAFTTANGLRSGSTRIMLVLSAYPHAPVGTTADPTAASQTAQSQGIKVLSVGAGNGVSTADVINIASAPQVSGSTYFLIPSFDQLFSNVPSVTNQICPSSGTSAPSTPSTSGECTSSLFSWLTSLLNGICVCR